MRVSPFSRGPTRMTRGGGAAPSWLIDYDATRSAGPLAQLPAGTTFTRASAALAIDHNGVPWIAKSGEIVEWGKRRVENVLLSTGDISAGSWSVVNAGLASEGKVTNNSGSTNWARARQNLSLSAGPTYFFSARLEPGNTAHGALALSDGSSYAVWFDLITGTVIGNDAGITVGVKTQADGTKRYWIKRTLTTGGTVGFNVGPAGSTGTQSAAGEFVYVTAPQLELAAPGQTEPSEYVPNGAPPEEWLGPELVTNGTFADGTTGWSQAQSTISVIDGELEVLSTAANWGQAGQVIQLPVGKKYLLSGTVSKGTAGTRASIDIYDGSVQSTAINASSGEVSGSYLFTTQGSGQVVIKLNSWVTAIGQQSYFDNISLREVRYPNNVDGVQYFNTDENGNPIPKATMRGIIAMPSMTNIVRAASDLTQSNWTKRGSASVTAAYDPVMGGLYTQVRDVGVAATDDIYTTTGSLSASVRYEPCFMLRPVSVSGTLKLSNAAVGDSAGRWDINLSLVNGPSLINRYHPAVTVVTEFSTTGAGNIGIWLSAVSGSLDFDISMITLVAGTAPAATPIPNSSTSAAATRAGELLLSPFEASEGMTVLAAYNLPAVWSSAGGLFAAHDSADLFDERVEFRSGNKLLFATAGASVVVQAAPAGSATGDHIVGVAATVDDYYVNLDGATAVDADAAFPTGINRIHIGGIQASTSAGHNGTIRAIRAKATRLPNDTITREMERLA